MAGRFVFLAAAVSAVDALERPQQPFRGSRAKSNALTLRGNDPMGGGTGLVDMLGLELTGGRQLSPYRVVSSLGVGSSVNSHTCVILDDSSLKCWGRNAYGQLGLDSTANAGDAAGSMAALVAVNLGTGRTAKQVTLGYFFTCAILDDNSVKCWGANDAGQLGIDSTSTKGNAAGDMASLVAVNVGAGRTAKQVVVGNSHACTILDNDQLKCWGQNSFGQLGYDSNTDIGKTAGDMAALAAINLGSGRTAKQAASGQYHVCVILDNNSVKCWGFNAFGQLGIDSTTTKGIAAGDMASLVAINLGAGRTAKSVACGGGHTCAILDNDELKCWGYNAYGQLGLDSTTDIGGTVGSMAALAAVNVGTGRTAKQVAAGYYHTCVILDDDSVKCWGYNYYGQLGYDSTTDKGNAAGDMAALVAVNLGTGRTAKQVACGQLYSCALLDDDSVKCWGQGSFGQLGQDSTTNLGGTVGSMAALAAINVGAAPPTPSATPSPSQTTTVTSSLTASSSTTPTPSMTATSSLTASETPTPSASPSPASPSNSVTPSTTNTVTASHSHSNSRTPSATFSPGASPSVSSSPCPTLAPAATVPAGSTPIPFDLILAAPASAVEPLLSCLLPRARTEVQAAMSVPISNVVFRNLEALTGASSVLHLEILAAVADTAAQQTIQSAINNLASSSPTQLQSALAGTWAMVDDLIAVNADPNQPPASAAPVAFAPSASPSPVSKADNSLDEGGVTGIATGAVVFAAMVFIALALVIAGRRKRAQQSTQLQTPAASNDVSSFHGV